MLIKHFCYLNVRIGHLLPQLSYTPWPSCPLERHKMEFHPKKCHLYQDKEEKAEVVQLSFYFCCLPCFKWAFLHFNFSRNLGTSGQKNRPAKSNFHIALICSMSFVGTKLTEAVNGQPCKSAHPHETLQKTSILLTYNPKRGSFGEDTWRRLLSQLQENITNMPYDLLLL